MNWYWWPLLAGGAWIVFYIGWNVYWICQGDAYVPSITGRRERRKERERQAAIEAAKPHCGECERLIVVGSAVNDQWICEYCLVVGSFRLT